jgi:hypothetical protein
VALVATLTCAVFRNKGRHTLLRLLQLVLLCQLPAVLLLQNFAGRVAAIVAITCEPAHSVESGPVLLGGMHLPSAVSSAAALHPLQDAADARRCAGAGLLCFGLSGAVGARNSASAARSTTSCWRLLCWAAAALFATAAHLGFALGLRAAGFDSRSIFLQGTS